MTGHQQRPPDFRFCSVIPGRGLQPASPESLTQDSGYGFRARRLRAVPE